MSSGESPTTGPPEPTLITTRAESTDAGATGGTTSGASPAVPQAGGERTRTKVAFTGLLAGALILIVLLIFILENTRSVKISFLGAGGHLPLGIALLFAAVGGALLVGFIGAARIAQLRLRMRSVTSRR